MPTWNEIDSSIKARIDEGIAPPEVCDEIRQAYLRSLAAYTKRPVVAYYSGFLQKKTPNGGFHPEVAINDFDMNGFMAVFHNLDRTSGIDLILHTPGGGTEATRAIVEYIYMMFGKDIRVIVPQIAMSAGTMIACAAREIIMGKHSCLGPADPQVDRGMPAMGVLHEIDKALEEIQKNPIRQMVWQEVFRKYPPAFLARCERAIEGTKEMLTEWLIKNMFSAEESPQRKAELVVQGLVNFSRTTEHSHHFMIDHCQKMGLNVTPLEHSQDLQEHVLSVHHAFVSSFARLRSIKIIENSSGASWNVSA